VALVITLAILGLLVFVVLPAEHRGPEPWSATNPAPGQALPIDARAPEVVEMIDAVDASMLLLADGDDGADLRPGTCLNAPDEVVDCGRPHRGEVVLVNRYQPVAYRTATPESLVEGCVYGYSASHGPAWPVGTEFHALAPTPDPMARTRVPVRCVLWAPDGVEPLIGFYS
jgi:hypothetical protein